MAAEYLASTIALEKVDIAALATCMHVASRCMMPFKHTCATVGRELAEHIMRVLTTSRGVVAAAAAVPASPPISRSSNVDGCMGKQVACRASFFFHVTGFLWLGICQALGTTYRIAIVQALEE